MTQGSEKIFSNGRAYIEGFVNEGFLTPERITKVGQVAGLVFRNGGPRPKVIIGKEPRISSYQIEYGLALGFLSVGMEVKQTGPIPAPAIAALTDSMKCDLGVMIGAPGKEFDQEKGLDYNGIEIFGPSRHPLSADKMDKMERLFRTDLSKLCSRGAKMGNAKRIDVAQDRYVEYVKGTLPRGTSFKDLRVVLDCAHGSAYKVAPQAFEELSTELFWYNATPNGTNINHECGPDTSRAIKEKAHYHRADVSFAFDGSGSRLCVVDEKGSVVEHATLQALFAKKPWKDDPLVMALQIAAMIKEKGPASQIFTK